MEKAKKGKMNTGNRKSDKNAKSTREEIVSGLPPSYAFIPILEVLINLIERGYFELFRGQQ